MSRKASKPEGTIDWNPKITNIPAEVPPGIKILAAKLSAKTKIKVYIGDLLRRWILAGLAKDTKRTR